MCALALRSVDDLEQHGVCNVELCEFVQCRSGQEHFTAMVGLLTFGTRHHGDRVASVVFVEAARARATLQHGALIHAHRVVVGVEVVGLGEVLV